MCLCWCCPPSLPAHPFPHCLGYDVWTSEWSPLKQVSLLPVWLSAGVFLHIDFIMSVTLSLTLGALYVCHCFIIMLFWPALNVRREASQDVFLHCYLRISVAEDFFQSVTACSGYHITNIYVPWMMQNFPLVQTVIRPWLHSAYIYQPLEVVSSINPVESA